MNEINKLNVNENTQCYFYTRRCFNYQNIFNLFGILFKKNYNSIL